MQTVFEDMAQGKVHSKRLALMLYTTRSKLRAAARSKQAPTFGNITGTADGMIVEG